MMNFNNLTGKVMIAGFIFGTARRYPDAVEDVCTPRFDFAYQLDRNTVLRGGFGLFYNANNSGGGLYRMHRYLPFAASDAR